MRQFHFASQLWKNVRVPRTCSNARQEGDDDDEKDKQKRGCSERRSVLAFYTIYNNPGCNHLNY